ncbi:uncharacterized protein LOC113964503 [Neopelma chrysocephalum]|uniref:uncharacterized protein LOC113964503 n=1 Tax=Neopelma chrysocephalum TaxID=114329 RepID=UPI000FCD497A|nr:uncharacterized protein LOC113964503 [Neopelma chrysocephalum]
MATANSRPARPCPARRPGTAPAQGPPRPGPRRGPTPPRLQVVRHRPRWAQRKGRSSDRAAMEHRCERLGSEVANYRVNAFSTLFHICVNSEPDLLLGFLDSLDPEMFLRCADSESTCLEKLEKEIFGETNSISTSISPPLGSPSAKLEAIDELIRFDHVYTKPLILEIPVEASNQTNMLVKIEKESLLSSEDEAIPEVPVSVKEEPVDSFMPELGISHLLSSHRSLEASNYLLDACNDSGYEGSLSPFSDMFSPLGTDHVWENSFASELFSQLISV